MELLGSGPYAENVVSVKPEADRNRRARGLTWRSFRVRRQVYQRSIQETCDLVCGETMVKCIKGCCQIFSAVRNE